jgi:hypothetical protein
MSLTRTEKERILDSRLKIQSVVDSLKHVDPKKLDNYNELQDCLDVADETFREALRKPVGP